MVIPAITPEALGAAVVFIVGVFAGAARYMAVVKGKLERKPEATDTVLSAVGMELGGRHQTEMLINAILEVAKAIRDKRQDEMTDKMDSLLDQLRRAEEHRDELHSREMALKRPR